MKWKSESLFLFWTDTCCLHEQSVETFLSCCDNIMPQIHCTFCTKSVVLVAYYAGDPLHILYEVCGFGRKEISSCVCSWSIFDSPYKTLCHYHWWLNSLLLRLMYSLYVGDCLSLFSIVPVNLWVYSTVCVHVRPFPVWNIVHIQANGARNVNNTWKQKVHLIAWQIVRHKANERYDAYY